MEKSNSFCLKLHLASQEVAGPPHIRPLTLQRPVRREFWFSGGPRTSCPRRLPPAGYALFRIAGGVEMLLCSWQRLHRELPLSAEELEDVFDSLDAQHSGYLTLEAFSSGFSTCP